MLPTILIGIFKTLIVDKAQDLAVEHVRSVISSSLTNDQKKELDQLVSNDKAHSFNTFTDFIKS